MPLVLRAEKGSRLTVAEHDANLTHLEALALANAFDAEAVRDTIGDALTEGAGIDVTVDDAGDTFTISAQVTPASLATSLGPYFLTANFATTLAPYLTSYLQTANLGAALNAAAGDPSVDSVITLSAAGALGSLARIPFGDATAFDYQAGTALGLTAAPLAAMRRSALLAPVSNVITIPTSANTNTTTRAYGLNFRSEITANTTYGFAVRDAAHVDQYQQGILEIVNTSGGALDVQAATSGGVTGRVPVSLQPGAASTVSLAAGACLTVFYLYAPALGSRAAQWRYNPVVFPNNA